MKKGFSCRLQGFIIWEYLALDLGSFPLHYNNLFANFWTCYKPCSFLLPKVGRDECAEVNVYRQLFVFVH